MKILVIGYNIPATSNMPGSPRLFNLCRGLSARHRLTLLTLSSSEERRQEFLADPMVAGVFDEIEIRPDAPRPNSWLGRNIHRLRREPFFVTRYRTPEFHADHARRIRHVFLDGHFDAIFADGLPAAQYVEAANLNCPAVIDLHDSMTLFVTRMRERETGWLRRMSLRSEIRSIGNREKALSRTFGAVVFNSPVDEEFFGKLDPTAYTRTIPNGVDANFFGASDVQVDPRKLVFTGVMSYGPNDDAARYFAESILPLIHRRHPEAEFWIVGKDPLPATLELAKQPGVHVTGGVPDIRPYVQTAAVYVSPLRFGTGVKNKLLAALAMRRPMVATSRTTEGLDVRAGQDLLVADAPADFAEKVIQLLDNPELGKQLAESGQAFVRDRYSWESYARMLDDTIVEVVQRHNSRSARSVA